MSFIVEVKVFPQSGRQSLIIDKSGILKCFILAAPEDGKANKELIELFAKLLELKKQDIEIMSGLISRKKKLMIHGTMTYEQMLEKLKLDNQIRIFK